MRSLITAHAPAASVSGLWWVDGPGPGGQAQWHVPAHRWLLGRALSAP